MNHPLFSDLYQPLPEFIRAFPIHWLPLEDRAEWHLLGENAAQPRCFRKGQNRQCDKGNTEPLEEMAATLKTAAGAGNTVVNRVDNIDGHPGCQACSQHYSRRDLSALRIPITLNIRPAWPPEAR